MLVPNLIVVRTGRSAVSLSSTAPPRRTLSRSVARGRSRMPEASK